SSFGLFSLSPDGSGPAIAQSIRADGSTIRNQLTTPALPREYVTLWGTGIGDFTTEDVTVEVYGKLLRPTFAGHAPSQPGLDQINFRLPADIPTGCYIPITVTVSADDISNVVPTLPGARSSWFLGMSDSAAPTVLRVPLKSGTIAPVVVNRW